MHLHNVVIQAPVTLFEQSEARVLAFKCSDESMSCVICFSIPKHKVKLNKDKKFVLQRALGRRHVAHID